MSTDSTLSSNLIYMPLENISWSQEECNMILSAVVSLGNGLQNPEWYHREKHQQQLKQLTELFWEDNEEITKNNDQYPTRFPPELIILYELVSIYNLVDRFYRQAGN